MPEDPYDPHRSETPQTPSVETRSMSERSEHEEQPDERPRDGEAGEPETRSPRLRMAVAAVAVLAVGALVALLAVKLRPEAERRETHAPPPLVEVVEVTTGPVALSVHSQGTVEPRTASTLVAQVAGRVVAVDDSWADGGLFRRGDVLLQIDPRDYELALRDARAARAQAETRLQREEAEAEVARQEWEELGGDGEPNPLVLRRPQVAEARAALEAAEAAVERAQLELSRTRVVAPFDGRVRSKEADLGQHVAPGTPLGRVFATEVAEIRLPVEKEELAYLDVGVGWSEDRDGDGPVVSLSGELAGATPTWPARLVRTGAEIDPRTRMLDLFARVDDPLARDRSDGAAPLPVGLFVEAEIAGRNVESAAVLPRRVLRPTERTRDTEVLVVDAEDRIRFRRVEVLRAVGDEVVVGSGLSDGERVVTSPLDEAVDGMEVRTTAAPPEPGGFRGGSEPRPDAEDRL